MRSEKKVLAIFALLSTLILLTGCSKETKLGVSNLPDRFTDREPIISAYYIPNANLVMSKESVSNWDRKLEGKFEHADGTNYILHLEKAHYDKIGSVIDPNYEYQINIEIPEWLVRKGSRIEAKDLNGYLVWGGINSIYRNDFSPVTPNKKLVPSEEGFLYIRRILSDNTMIAKVNLYFEDEKTKDMIRIFGKIAAPMKKRSDLFYEESNLKGNIKKKARELNETTWPTN